MNNRLKRPLLALALAALLGAGFAQDTGIRVNGTGTVFGAPDMAQVMLGVDIADEDARTALTLAGAAMDEVLAAIEVLGIPDEDVRTVAFNMFRDERFGPDGQSTGSGYRVIHQVQITLHDIDALGDLLAEAVAAGSNSVGGIEFGIADTKALEAQARDLAMADALARAEALAAAAEVVLGAPIGISEGGGFGVGGGFERAAMQDMSFSVPVATGQLAVTVVLSVLFAIGE